MYVGHNNGSKYYSDDKVFDLQQIHPLCFLMGCSSVRLGLRENVVNITSVYYYLLKRCPMVVGCLWDVGDADIDRVTKRILEYLLVQKG